MSILRLILCIALCLGIGALGSLVTASEIPTWYASLNKPAWTPPPAVFPVVWTILYVLMGISLWLLWQAAKSEQRAAALGWFALQLAFNAIWTPVFFGMHAPLTGLIVIVATVRLLVPLSGIAMTAAP